MILSCLTTHSASRMRNDMIPRKVLAASVTAVRQASSKLTSDCDVTSILRTIAMLTSCLACLHQLTTATDTDRRDMRHKVVRPEVSASVADARDHSVDVAGF